jgi:hypothetical protein
MPGLHSDSERQGLDCRNDVLLSVRLISLSHLNIVMLPFVTKENRLSTR